MSFIAILLAAFALLVQSASAQQYDLLLKGGHVIDPRNKIDRPLDVAVKDGRIAAVAGNIAPAQAKQTVDVAGLYVTPGLVDIHVHVYAGTGMRGAYAGDNSVYPDGFTFRIGVTTVVDAGELRLAQLRRLQGPRDRPLEDARPRLAQHRRQAAWAAARSSRTSPTWRPQRRPR